MFNFKMVNNLSSLLNNQKFKDQTENIKKSIRNEFYKIGKVLVKTSRDMMKEPKSGRTYQVTLGSKGKKLKRIKDHISSAPGEAPAIITGALRDSVDFLVKGSEELHFGVNLEHITPDSGNAQWHNNVASYGKYLELGTVKMEKRPFLVPSMKKNGINLFVRLENDVKKESSP